MLGWFILIVPIVIIVVYGVIVKILESNKASVRGDSEASYKTHKGLDLLYKCEPKLYVLTLISALWLFISVVIVLVYFVEVNSFAAKYKKAVTEYEIRSDTFSIPERVAAFNYATILMAEAAVYQYWDKHFDPFIPDKITKLKPIR